MIIKEESPTVGLGLFLFNSRGQILIGRRINPRNGYGHNLRQLPGGHAHKFESTRDGIIRECKEETGLDIKENTLVPLGFEDGIDESLGLHYVECFFMAEAASDDAKNMEPEKNAEWEWVEADNLPSPMFDCTDRIYTRLKSLLIAKAMHKKIKKR